MKYSDRLEKAAEKQLEKLATEILDRITQQLMHLEHNPRERNVQKLRGVEGNRIRVGDYRILFTINDETREVRVYRVKHRREVYH
ncbi:MAG: type II toxin-antitoxin system RelE family toxin [Chloroflexota bacterium]